MKRDYALYVRLRCIAMSDERTRLDIVKDLIVGDLLGCKVISQRRETQPLSDKATITMSTDVKCPISSDT